MLKSINAYMKNIDYSYFLTKIVPQSTRIILKINTLLYHIRFNAIPPPTLLLYRSYPSPIVYRRIGSEVERRKYGHVRKEIGGMIDLGMGIFVNIYI